MEVLYWELWSYGGGTGELGPGKVNRWTTKEGQPTGFEASGLETQPNWIILWIEM